MDASESRNRSRAPAFFALFAILLTLPFLAWGVIGALASNSNDPRQWLPAGFDETDTYEWLQQHFGRDEITIVSWPDCRLGDSRIDRFVRGLVTGKESDFFQRAISGPGVLKELTTPPLDLSKSVAIHRLQGVLFGPDKETTCVILTVSERGEADRVAAIEQIFKVAGEACDLQPDQLKLAGPTVDAATIDVESQHLLIELSILSGIVAFAITWARLRSWRLSGIILVVAIYATGVSLSTLYVTGGHMNLVMTMLPPLVYVLSISAAVHLANYYRDAVAEGAGDAAPWQAILHGWRPCSLAAGTTAVGLISLSASEIVPVKMFGIYAAAGVCSSLAVVLVLIPVLLTLWPERPRRQRTPAERATGHGQLRRLAAFVCRHHTAIVVVCLLLVVGMGVGLSRLQSTVRLQYRFGADSRIIADYRWLEQHLGALVPLEIVVHFVGDDRPEFLDQLRFVTGFEQHLTGMPDVGATLSGADFAPALPRGTGIRSVSRRAVLRGKEQEIRDSLTAARFLARDEQGADLWRITLRAPALSDVDYGRFVDTLRDEIEPVVASLPHLQVTYTGVIPLIYKAQRELLNDLVESFLLAFALIAGVMIAVLRDLRSGLIAMLPNVFPAVLIFGAMGWFGIWIEIGSIMTASAAMGIAVDDTFHFLTWFRAARRQGMAQQPALHYAYERCAGAMFHTTLICASGLLVFTFSSFMPVVRFSWMMAALLVAALVGDLVFLPALLASPLGKLFSPRNESHIEPASAKNR
jgi:predicted RND superfamily exporter protein